MGCSVIRPLFTAQKEWRDAKSKAPESLTKPMRTALMSCLVKELSQRVQQLKELGGTSGDARPVGLDQAGCGG